MSRLLFFMIVLLVIGYGIYLHKNDYSDKTLNVFIPSFGAFLFSIFMLLKYVYVDGPESKYHEIPIVVLHDKYTGQLYSLNGITDIKDIKESDGHLSGLRDIDRIPDYNKLKALNLRSSLIYKKPGYVIDTMREIVLDIVEFSFYSWLTDFNTPNWGTSKQFIFTISGGSTKYRSQITDNMEEKFTINQSNSKNRLLPSFGEFVLSLPTNSNIEMLSSNGIRKAVITSKYSILETNLVYKGGGVFQPKLSSEARLIMEKNRLANVEDRYQYHNFLFTLKFKLKPWFRDSKEASIHPSWFKRFLGSFEKNFSWYEISKKYN